MTEKDVQARLEDLRSDLDLIDAQIVKLLSDRAKIVMAVKGVKTSSHVAIYDPRREEEIFEKVVQLSDGTLYADALRDIYDCILRHMKEL